MVDTMRQVHGPIHGISCLSFFLGCIGERYFLDFPFPGSTVSLGLIELYTISSKSVSMKMMKRVNQISH